MKKSRSSSSRGLRKSTSKAPTRSPKKQGRGEQGIEQEDGPYGWFFEQVESAYFGIAPSDARAKRSAARIERRTSRDKAFKSIMRPGEGENVFAVAERMHWIDRLAEYKRRKAAVHGRFAVAAAGPGPVVPGGRNWIPLGPTVVLNGQTEGEEPVAGRIVGLAIASNGATIYAASACGGVFRSDDAGTSWQSLMDGFDVDPTNFASNSLACGAIAIDAADPNRIYVGTGEGDTYNLFKSRITNALPAYRGIGPIRSDDRGRTWMVESTAAGATPLAGEAFFSLAVDPADRENVVGATTKGLYQRAPKAGGGFEWRSSESGVYSSVVVARSGATTRFFAAKWGGKVAHSPNGATWSEVGTGFPATNVGRIALAVPRDNIDLLYAFVGNASGAVSGVFRLNGLSSEWKKISNAPDVIPTTGGKGQGDYDLAIAIDPVDSQLLYLGGSYSNAPSWPASVWRAAVEPTATGFKFSGSTSIGSHAHADVHVLTHSPGNPDELWCGCDGGVFLNRAPRATGQFAGLNAGLSCLCSNFIAQHPTDPGVIFTGLQDNGTARTSGGPEWSHVNYGDGGYCLINWANPDRVLTYVNGQVHRSNSGGQTHDDWTRVWNFGWVTMTQPIVAPPYDPPNPASADWVAVGAGPDVFVSKNFATTWPMQFTLPGGNSAGAVFALAFASTQRLFIGTTRGQVFRADRSGNAWTVTRLDNAGAGPIGLDGLISDVAVDWADATSSSIYIAFGGMGDRRHVWWFDGTSWQSKSGPDVGHNLLDVEHNAIIVDPTATANVYAAADIGVWHSADSGGTWEPLQNGLPDAAVFDLQIHPTQRLLRAATHGRGVYEISLH